MVEGQGDGHTAFLVRVQDPGLGAHHLWREGRCSGDTPPRRWRAVAGVPHARPVCLVQLCLLTGHRRASPRGSGAPPPSPPPALPSPGPGLQVQRRSPWTSQALGGWHEGFRGETHVQPLVQAAAVVWVDGVGLGSPGRGPPLGAGQGPTGADMAASSHQNQMPIPCLVWAHLAGCLPRPVHWLVPLDSAPLRPELASQLLRDTLLLHRPHPHPQLPESSDLRSHSGTETPIGPALAPQGSRSKPCTTARGPTTSSISTVQTRGETQRGQATHPRSHN